MHSISNTDIFTGYNKELKVEVAGRRLHSSELWELLEKDHIITLKHELWTQEVGAGTM